MRRDSDGEGVVFWLVVARWFEAKKTLTTAPTAEAVLMIRTRFDVSRATAYRWLKAWRDVNPATLFPPTNKGSQP